MRKLIGVVLFCTLIILFAGCSSGGSGSSGLTDTESSSASISAAGGSLTTPSGDAGLNVPAGALSNETSITVSKSNKSTPPGSIAVPYDYTPDGQTFSTPVTICIKYDPDSIPEGMSPSDLRLARLSDNGEWETTGASTVDTTNHLVCGQTSHFSTYTVVIHERKSFGEQTGEFNSVIAYSNGTTENISNEYNTYSSYTTGMKWLCDEYVNRYYKQIYNKGIRIEGSKASDYYDNAATRGLTTYPNDGTEQPQVGDILVSEYGEYGHVAIVREVQDNKIFVIQQNWSDNGADNRYPITRVGNHVYPFDGKKGNYAVKGWLRIKDTATSTTTTTTVTSTSTSTSSSTTITATTTSTTTTTVAATYSISGTVSGAVVSGITITLTGIGSSTTTTDSSGNFSFSGAANGSYILTAALSGYTFSPPSINVTVNNANVIGKNFTAIANTYTISGTVSGDVVSGATITLTGTGSNSTTTDASGNYTFSGATNGNYTLTPSLAGYIFSPASTSLTLNNSDVTGQNFTATVKQPWKQKTDFAGTARQCAVGFAIGTIGYLGTGHDGAAYKNDFWEYNPSLNTWTQKANFDGGGRYNAVGFSIGGKGYIGTGFTGGYAQDFWEYDPVENKWAQKANFGGGPREKAVGFSIGSKGYLGTGFTGSTWTNDFWEYDPTVGVNGTWTQLSPFGGAARWNAVGFSIGSKGYIGTGNADRYGGAPYYKDFWEYNPANNTWTMKKDFGGGERYAGGGFSIGNKGYLGMGGTSTTDNKDFWEYDPTVDTWTMKKDFGGGERYLVVGFSIGSKGYMGTGGYNGVRKDFWEYDPSLD